ncbi:zeta toxin family protein [Crenothrix polyspora]|uniref:Zeta toxin n=1 Tax=Crenothrix polyspora TaxID=360316 RepID=A0A1R4HBV4_9GAMM|nr:zeta toxin family protein [Crenothrix polyspora]SJM93734.1 Zeta toxin [Crenothrix polyspora]
MNKTSHLIQGYTQLKKLRIALAIAQATRLSSTLKQEIEDTVTQDQAKRVTYLTGLFSRIHRDLFYDWKEQATVTHRPGTMPNPSKRQQFREAIECLVLDGAANGDTAIFDNNGFAIWTENIAERLAVFYQKMRLVRPFNYGNRITLDFFMTALGSLPAFKSVYEQGIDFRRLDADDPTVLHHVSSSAAAVALAFRHALDPTRSKSLHNKANGYGRWPENKKFVVGIPFLSHKTTAGIDCLVSVTGGLIPINSIQTELLILGRHVADYPLSAVTHVIGYLPGTEALRQAGKQNIDGISIAQNGAAPLFCLDMNMLTGLRTPGHAELIDLLKQCEGDDALIFELANNETLKQKMLLAAHDERLERAVEIAYERLGKITQKLLASKHAIFEGKSADAKPKLFMSMGGAGSGKTAVEEIAVAQCSDNFVIASLDEFRKISDFYQILTAANHHSDDYMYVEPFATRLRSVVADYAREKRINILYDGTGIPYKPRYAHIVEQFKAAGFHTQVTAVDAFLVKPEGREDELPRSAVISSVKKRFKETGRALPWVVTVDKHLRAPTTFLSALQHRALDKISLFANDSHKNWHYLVAESFIFSNEEIRVLQAHQLAGSLAAYMKFFIEYRDDSIFKMMAKGNLDLLVTLRERNPAFNEANVAYQVYSSNYGNRVLLIYNTRRLVDFVEKRQLNPNASGEESLLHKPEALAFYIDPVCKEPWMTRLQD